MEELKGNHEFGALSDIKVEAIGDPGARTFRLLCYATAGVAILWLEKEQLYQFAVYIQQVCDDAGFKPADHSSNDITQVELSGNEEIEFKVGKLALGHDPDTNSFLVLVHKTDVEEGIPADLSFWLTVDQATKISRESLDVCAAGRPQCFLCGAPMNPEGHNCVRYNGHGELKT